MDDARKAQLIEYQKNSFTYGELTYEAGFEQVTITGWVGYTDLVVNQTPFGGIGKGTIAVLVIQDVETPMHDQEMFQIPITRMISLRTAPRMP